MYRCHHGVATGEPGVRCYQCLPITQEEWDRLERDRDDLRAELSRLREVCCEVYRLADEPTDNAPAILALLDQHLSKSGGCQ